MGYTATMTLKRCGDVLVLLDLIVCGFKIFIPLHLAIVSAGVLYM